MRRVDGQTGPEVLTEREPLVCCPKNNWSYRFLLFAGCRAAGFDLAQGLAALGQLRLNGIDGGSPDEGFGITVPGVEEVGDGELKVKTFKLSNDKRFVDKLQDIVGLYLNPPEKASVLSDDEKRSSACASPSIATRRGSNSCAASTRTRRPTWTCT